jgi:hypothetical protein
MRTLTALLALFAPAILEAAPVLWPQNGHYYELVDLYDPDGPGLGISWSDAEAEAATRAYEGATGHLVTITSETEHGFLYGNFMHSFARAWIGLRFDLGIDEWTWI